jgi:hypothetical protein
MSPVDSIISVLSRYITQINIDKAEFFPTVIYVCLHFIHTSMAPNVLINKRISMNAHCISCDSILLPRCCGRTSSSVQTNSTRYEPSCCLKEDIAQRILTYKRDSFLLYIGHRGPQALSTTTKEINPPYLLSATRTLCHWICVQELLSPRK